jgi:clan AA aspartic protease
MITGTVNAQNELVVRLPVHDSAGQEHEFEFVIDTGFTGSLTLLPSLIASLGLPWYSTGTAVLANGQIVQFDLYPATVVWDGVAQPIFLQSSDSAPLLGLRLLYGHDLRARIEPGGRVEIEAIP